MKTIKNMWALSRPMTVVTLLMSVFVLFALVMVWWIPVNFGYPLYCIIGNIIGTAIVVGTARSIAEVVNG